MALGQPLDSASQSIVIAPHNDSQVGWANGIIVCPR